MKHADHSEVCKMCAQACKACMDACMAVKDSMMTMALTAATRRRGGLSRAGR